MFILGVLCAAGAAFFLGWVWGYDDGHRAMRRQIDADTRYGAR